MDPFSLLKKELDKLLIAVKLKRLVSHADSQRLRIMLSVFVFSDEAVSAYHELEIACPRIRAC